MSDGPTVTSLLPAAGAMGGVVSLLLYVARLVFTGKLVPRSTLTDQQAHYKEQLAREKEISQEAASDRDRIYDALQKTVALTDAMSKEQRLTNDLLRGLKTVTAGVSGEGDPRT